MRHPHGLRAAAGAGSAAPALLTTITWSTNGISTGSFSGVNLGATTDAANNGSCNSTALPALTTTGFYFDIQALESGGSIFQFIGVANTTSSVTYGQSSQTSWYTSGSIFGSGSGDGPGTLVAGTHRIAVRTESGNAKIYFQKNTPTGAIAGPFSCPTGSTLYAIVMSQNGYQMGDMTIANGGAVYSTGGGLF